MQSNKLLATLLLQAIENGIFNSKFQFYVVNKSKMDGCRYGHHYCGCTNL